MKNILTVVVFSGLLGGVASGADARVEFRSCQKCKMDIRVDLAANKAYVNLSRLGTASKEARAARAARLLDLATIPPASDAKIRPLMGWSSWNTFGLNISESIILETATAMATNGLKDAGYLYVNIDDGFFWGHGEDGVLRFHPQRFPNGMKPVVDGIHALGLKAGIYSDAGADTCGSTLEGGNDAGGRGAGLYGHDAADCKLHFNELGFDFIKVDYCGGCKLGLDPRTRYGEIARAIAATGRKDVRLNICRWTFPGAWAADVAESWRTTGDIRAHWGSVRGIIAANLYLGAVMKAGHYNDMDMLEVGQLKGSVKTAFVGRDSGLTADEETTHFGMWCMLSSPLLIGCDVRKLPASTKKLITNPYLLRMNQNELGVQGQVAAREGEAYVLVKDADVRFGPARYVALYNAGDNECELAVRASALELGGEIQAFDLVEMGDPGSFRDTVTVTVRPHASKFYRFEAERRLEATRYEAEWAFLPDYHGMANGAQAGFAHVCPLAGGSGGMGVRYLGNRPTNGLVWRDVLIRRAGTRRLVSTYASPDDRFFSVRIDGGPALRVEAPATHGALAAVELQCELSAGVHEIGLSNPAAWAPDFDKLELK